MAAAVSIQQLGRRLKKPLRRGTDCAHRHRHARADVRRRRSDPVHGRIRFRTDELVTARNHRGSHASHRGSHATRAPTQPASTEQTASPPQPPQPLRRHSHHSLLHRQPTLSCASKPGERTQCPADTSKGVVLLRSTGDAPCLLGKTWGYDQTSVWVSDGCSAEFATGPVVEPETRSPSPSRTFRTSASCSSTERRARSISGCSATRAI